MPEQYAGMGTKALSILGTTLGGIAVAGPALLGTLGAGRAVSYEGTGACMHDIETVKQMGEKDAEIARLKSEKYADGVREDAKQYGIEIYKELKKDIREVEKDIADFKATENAKWTEQMVVNAKVSDTLTALTGTTQTLAGTLAQITKIAVPQSAICDFGAVRSGCNSCGNNI